jgi:dihydroxyacetone kinase-like predicted kinase
LIVYDPEAPADENAAEMERAMATVATGEVTQAIRDSSSDAGPITAGDWIGMVRGEGIVAVGESVVVAATTLLEQLLTPDRELLTIITGSGAQPSTTAEIGSWVEQRHPDVQVEVHAGGQPLYPYLFGVE